MLRPHAARSRDEAVPGLSGKLQGAKPGTGMHEESDDSRPAADDGCLSEAP